VTCYGFGDATWIDDTFGGVTETPKILCKRWKEIFQDETGVPTMQTLEDPESWNEWDGYIQGVFSKN